jgi:hypothetical protein
MPPYWGRLSVCTGTILLLLDFRAEERPLFYSLHCTRAALHSRCIASRLVARASFDPVITLIAKFVSRPSSIIPYYHSF